jgi:hypothetical protein
MSEIDLSIENTGIEAIYYILRKNAKKGQKDNDLFLEQFIFNQNNSNYNKEEIKQAIKYIPFTEKTNWKYSSFSTEINKNNVEYPEILSNSWTPICPNVDNGMDITYKIFECEESINYKLVNNLVKANVVLQGESMFWIFLHTNNHKFDDKTVVIVFSKKEYTQRVTMSLGSFVNLDYIKSSENKGNNFFLFQKQQLIKSYKIPKNNNEDDNYESGDKCLIKITVYDEGYDKIKIVAKLNDGEEENELIGRICKQVACFDSFEQSNTNTDAEDKNYRVMIAGNGNNCKVNSFFCETNLKSYIGSNRNETEGCECCELI